MADDPEEPAIIGQIKDKLIHTKEKWAEDGRLITGHHDTDHVNRLPPGQKLVTNWPVLDLGAQPDVKPDRWRLQILGTVENPIVLTLDAFKGLPPSQFVSDIHCVTSWSRYDNHWDGIAARTIIDLVKPKPETTHVLFHSYDGYTTNLKLDVFADDDVILAHTWEGKPLAREHGGPVRVVIPKWYFWKSAKWVTRIVFSDHDVPGFWETRGYHNEGDPWKEERYS